MLNKGDKVRFTRLLTGTTKTYYVIEVCDEHTVKLAACKHRKDGFVANICCCEV